MPAVPAALAEIEDRLEEIRYRLNRRTLLSVLSPVVATFLILAALVTWSAARGTAESFTLALWAGGAVCALVLVRGIFALVNRWLSVADAARLADERAGMRERLSTVHWLARSGQQLPLAPVVIADALEQRPRWQASAIIPRRFPWELGLPLGGLLALAAAVFLDDPILPSLEELMKRQPSPEHQMEMAVPIPPPPPTPAALGQPGTTGEPLLEVAGEGGGDGGALGLEAGEAGERATSSAALTAQVRDAIRKALQRFEQTERPRDLARAQRGDGSELPEADLPPKPGLLDVAASKQAGATRGDDAKRAGAQGEQPGEESARAAETQKRGRDATESMEAEKGLPRGRNDLPRDDTRAVAADAYKPRQEDADVASMPGTGEVPETQDGTGSGGREHDRPADEARMKGDADPRAKPRPGDGAVAGNQSGEGSQKGGAKAAGSSGTGGGEGLFGKAGDAGSKPLPGAPKGTFKLTLGSFLTAGPGAKETSRRRDPVAANPRAVVAEPPALNPDQTADDALRRADIPPEYEEIVRRIYSSRPAR